MIVLDNITALFEIIATIFDEIADSVDGIPIIGDYLAIPFYSTASQFENLVNNFSSFSDWCDTIGEIIGGEIGNFLILLNRLHNDFIDVFNALPSFEELIGFLEEHFEILTMTPEKFYEWIKDFLPPIPTTENIIEGVSDAFESILDKLFEEEE